MGPTPSRSVPSSRGMQRSAPQIQLERGTARRTGFFILLFLIGQAVWCPGNRFESRRLDCAAGDLRLQFALFSEQALLERLHGTRVYDARQARKIVRITAWASQWDT